MLLTRPSKYVQSLVPAMPARTRSAMASPRSRSAWVHGRERRTSASASARPPTPLCVPSRSQEGPAAPGSVAEAGIHGPSSQRTWSSTQRHAASARSR
jgi:hypothetical protein